MFISEVILLSVRIGCPDPDALQVYDKKNDEFICAFTYDDKNPWDMKDMKREGCKGNQRTHLSGTEYSNNDGRFTPIGSLIVMNGCEFIGYEVNNSISERKKYLQFLKIINLSSMVAIILYLF